MPDWFSSEEACLSYLERLIWPHGFACDCDECVVPFVQESVEPGARVRTFAWRGASGGLLDQALDACFNEFVCRFDRRTSGSRGMLFYRLLEQAVITKPVTYLDITQTTQAMCASA